jgi:transcriptional regulator GlxA family with amidase domain
MNDPQLPAVHLCAVLGELCGVELQKIGRGELTAPAAPIEEGTDINRLSRLDYLINTCYTDSALTVSRAAGLLYISARQLERIMQARYGMSFRRKLCERRLEVAAHLLCESALPLEQLCTRVGFPNRNTLTRAFTARFGCPPSQYRAKAQKPAPFGG